MQRNLLVLLIGLLIGGGLGAYLGFVALPVQLVDVGPDSLTEAYQADYLRLIAATYAVDDDFVAARERLASLRREDLNTWVLAQTVDSILTEEDEVVVRQMVLLADSLGLSSPAMAPYLPAEEGGDG